MTMPAVQPPAAGCKIFLGISRRHLIENMHIRSLCWSVTRKNVYNDNLKDGSVPEPAVNGSGEMLFAGRI
jgi:hypothetical protein